jgi:6-phosphogluconolactonase
MTSLYRCDDAEALAQKACQWLLEDIQTHQSSNTRPYTLGLAGGSTPRALYQLLAAVSSTSLDWNRVILFWGDERNVIPEHPDSNYLMVLQSLLAHIDIPAENVLAVPQPGGDAAHAALAYEQVLKNRIPVDRNGNPIINCILLGLGDDVHTASLFPETTALAESKRWVVSNFVPKLNAWRITTTAPLINSANQVAFLIAGAGKRQALSQLWHATHNPTRYPSQLISPRHGQLTFFVDNSALEGVAIPAEFELRQ